MISDVQRLWLIVPAAGSGRRMGSAVAKQYLPLGDSTVMAQTLATLHLAFPGAELCLCLGEDDEAFDSAVVPFARWRRVAGGAERVHSVNEALEAIAAEASAHDLVLVHDVARPCVTPEDLRRLAEAAAGHEAGALLAAPVADTMKRDDGHGRVASTQERRGLWHAQTPQGFRYGLLRQALAEALSSNGLGAERVTDEASAVEALGLAPLLVAGRRDNIKITHPEDLSLAELILTARAVSTRLQESTRS